MIVYSSGSSLHKFDFTEWESLAKRAERHARSQFTQKKNNAPQAMDELHNHGNTRAVNACTALDKCPWSIPSTSEKNIL